MSKIKVNTAKGTRDFGPLQLQKRKYIIECMENVFKKFGFMQLETPAMENLDTLTGKYGDEGDQLLFKILNSGDYLKDLKEHNTKGLAHEEMDHTFLPSVSGKLNDLDSKLTLPFIAEKGLRYDLTVPFARFVVMNRNNITLPFKRFQMQPVWRADKPQKGRYREFWQCDVDVVGSDSLICDAELMQIYLEVFSTLKLKFKLHFNHRQILDGLADILGIGEKFTEMTNVLDKLDKIGVEKVKEELISLGANEELLISFFQFLQDNSINRQELIKYFNKSDKSLKGLNDAFKVLDILSKSGISTQDVHLNLGLARGLSYYTGCIFEVVATEGSLRSSIGGGGRYDNLTGNFGMEGIPGTGASFGLDRIYDVMDELKLFPENIRAGETRILFCYFDEATQTQSLKGVSEMRKAGISAEIYPDIKKVGKQLEYANALKIPFVALCGENELLVNKFMLKNMIAGTQELLSLDEIISLLK